MKTRFLAGLAAAAALALGPLAAGAPANAITGGSYDGAAHPYVAYEDNGVRACTGTLLSPTVMLTAAHCFTGSTSTLGTNRVTGAPLVRVDFDPDLLRTPSSQRTWHVGSFYADPRFRMRRGDALGSDRHDVAVIVFTASGCTTPPGTGSTYRCGPIPAGVTSGRYGTLPRQGLDGRLRTGTRIGIVGYGAQRVQKRPGAAYTRSAATTRLIAAHGRSAAEFLELHTSTAGTCFGDSGGPNLLAGTNVVLAETSFGTGSTCTGDDYAYRVDTAQALGWIRATAGAHGGRL